MTRYTTQQTAEEPAATTGFYWLRARAGFINTGGNCVVTPDANEVIAYAELAAGDFLSCLPDCVYKDVNFIRHGLDVDGRTVVELSWHTPGTQKVRYIKRVLVDPGAPGQPAALTTFKETITFD